MKRRILSMLLALCLVLALLPGLAADAADRSTEAERTFDAMEKLVIEGLSAGETSIDIASYGLTAEPDMSLSPFWGIGDGRFVYDEATGCYTTLKLEAGKTGETAALEAAVAQLDALVAKQPTEEKKALALHDYMVAEYSYDLTYSRYNIEDLLLEKTGVCQAYADLYCYILQRAGMECYTVASDEMWHAWNILRVDGQYYHVDVTWDDPVPDQPGLVCHDFFLISDAAIQTARRNGSSVHYGWEPTEFVCSSTKYDNAFWTDVNSPIVLADSGYYYVSNSGICKRDTVTGKETVLRGNLGRWYVWGSSSYWVGVFSGLLRHGDYLYYNTAREIRRIALDGTGDTCVYAADTSTGYLYGCLLRDGYIWGVMSTKPNTAETQLVQMAPLTHSYTAVVTPPTCTAQGYTTYTCACGESYVADYVPAWGHSYADGKCTVCGEIDPDYSGPAVFYDVSTGDWFKEAVDFVVANGLMNGVGDYKFEPEESMTRAMLVTVLYRLAGEPAVAGENPFTDVANGQWFTNPILWASENGIVNGVGKGLFEPEEPVTREQMATILHRYASQKGYSTDAAADLSAYPDADKVNDWARTPLAWANAAGLINGTTFTGMSGTWLDPQGSATRAQVATILMRFVVSFTE